VPQIEKNLKIAAAFCGAALLAEFIVQCNEVEEFEFTSIDDPRALPWWLIINLLSYLALSVPKPVAYSFKVILPLLTFFIMRDVEQAVEIKPEAEKLVNQDYSPYLKNYLSEQKKNHKLFDTYVANVDGNKNEPDEMVDCIRYTLMKTPVTLYSHKYDLQTLLSLDPKLDPFTRTPFEFRDIQPDKESATKIKAHMLETMDEIQAEPQRLRPAR